MGPPTHGRQLPGYVPWADAVQPHGAAGEHPAGRVGTGTQWGHGGDTVGMRLVPAPPSPCSIPQPPTPEADYPDLSPDELEGYPEEDYSPLGSYEQGAAHYLPPRYPEELGSSPGWYGHSHPEGAPGYPEHFGTETVWGRDGTGWVGMGWGEPPRGPPPLLSPPRCRAQPGGGARSGWPERTKINWLLSEQALKMQTAARAQSY